jgi:heme/copper-type cytochrome/quinol oxidase subunit 1
MLLDVLFNVSDEALSFTGHAIIQNHLFWFRGLACSSRGG